jgi:hypothetical protein
MLYNKRCTPRLHSILRQGVKACLLSRMPYSLPTSRTPLPCVPYLDNEFRFRLSKS